MYVYDTISEALNDLNKRGYTIDFNMRKDSVYCRALDRSFKPEEFEIVEFYRFDDDSDPGGQSIVYAIGTNDGYKGVLVDAYGVYSDPLSFEMIQKLKTHSEKNKKMIIGVFKYKLNPEFKEEFDNLYGHAVKYLDRIEGYNGHEVFDGEDGHKMVVVAFQDKASFLVWDEHPEHKKYKERGKKEVFLSYDVSVGEVFERHTKP